MSIEMTFNTLIPFNANYLKQNDFDPILKNEHRASDNGTFSMENMKLT